MMMKLILLLFLILTLDGVTGDKLPPPQATITVCDKVESVAGQAAPSQGHQPCVWQGGQGGVLRQDHQD